MASRFWVGGTGTWDTTTTTNWSATSGGAGGASNPTVSDDVFLDGNSGTGTITLSINTICKSLNCTGYAGTLDTGSFTVTLSSAISGADLTLSSTGTYTNCGFFYATSSVGTITTNGKTFKALSIGSVSAGGVVTLADATNITGTVSLSAGTLNTGSFNHTWAGFSSSTVNTRVLTMNASNITVTATGTPWATATTTGMTVNAGTSTITFSGTNQTFSNGSTAGGSKTYNNVVIASAGAINTFVLGGAGTFNNITFTAVGSNDRLSFNGTGTLIITGTLTANGASALVPMHMINANTGSAYSIQAASTSFSNVNFRDITASGAAAWSGTLLGDCQGNTGITFTTPANMYWVGDVGTFNVLSKWATTSGGTGGGAGTRIPLPQDTAVFDANSFLANTKTVTLTGQVSIGTMDWSAITKTGIQFISSAAIAFYGSLLGAGTSDATALLSGGGAFTFLSRKSETLSKVWAGGTVSAITFGSTAAGGTYTLTSDMGGSTVRNVWFGALTLACGTLNLNGFNLNVSTVAATGTQTRSLRFGGGSITLNQTATSAYWSASSTGFTVDNTGGGTIIFRQALGAGIVATFNGGGLSYPTLQHTVAGSLGSIAIGDTGNTFTDIVFSDASNARTLTLLAGSTTTLTSATPLRSFLGTAGKLMSLVSATAASTATIALPNGYGSSDFVNVKDIVVTTKPWYAGSNSTNGGNNTNVIFSTLAAAITAALTLGMSAGGSASPGATANLSLSAGAAGSASPPATAALALLLAATGQAADTAVASLVLSLAATAQAPDTSSAAISLAMAATARAPDTATAVLALSMLAGASASPAPTAALALVLLSAAQATPSPTAAISLSIIATAVIGILRDITASAEIVPGRMSAGVVEQKRMSATVLP